jgi:tRNA(Phe) wybutosine-synthesizing methylase Tyw3
MKDETLNTEEFRELIEIAEVARGTVLTSRDLHILIKLKNFHKVSNNLIKYLLIQEKNLTKIEKMLSRDKLFKEKEKNEIDPKIINVLKKVFSM